MLKWPTPTATSGGGNTNRENRERTGGPNLKEVVRNWATPTCSIAGKQSCGRRADADTTNQAYSLHQETQTTQGGEIGHGRVLNPKFVNALMGIPIGWTNCASTVGVLSRYKQRMRSAFLRLALQEGEVGKIKGLSRYADFIASEWEKHSWQEVLAPGEALGGPSPMGSSKWQDFKDCPYKYYLKYVRRYREENHQVALEVGGLFHEALARYFQGWLDGASLKEVRERAFEIVRRADEVVPDIASEVHRLLTAWMTLYHGTAYSFLDRVIGVEYLVSSAKKFRYSARLDLILETEDGGIELMDHKTARQYDANMLMSYRLEPQFIGHMHLWQESGMEQKWGPLRKYTVDLITKTNQPTMDLVDVPVRQNIINEWRAEMCEHWRQFQFYRRSVRVWPRRTGYQCRFCECFDHCASDNHSLVGWVKKKEGEF